jgi:hypothetical protein
MEFDCDVVPGKMEVERCVLEVEGLERKGMNGKICVEDQRREKELRWCE